MIQLSYTISADRNTLTLHADKEAQYQLLELRNGYDDWGCHTMETEVCEYLISNSELQWVSPTDTGDLTDAPILGILGKPQMENSGPFGAVWCGKTEQGPEFQPILDRWGYEPYQVRSFLHDLLEEGKANFINSW